MKTNLISTFLVCFFVVQSAFGQWYFEVKFVGISVHLKENPHPHLYKRKFDRKGFVVLNAGVILSVEKFVYNDLVSIKFAQAIFSDCANQFAGFSHLGFRLNKELDNHHFAIGNGPTMFYRKDWSGLTGYIDEGLFKRNENYQYRFFWYAGEVNYGYKLSDQTQLSFTLLPGPPEFATIAAGLRLTE
jgi:hypothetical protein